MHLKRICVQLLLDIMMEYKLGHLVDDTVQIFILTAKFLICLSAYRTELINSQLRLWSTSSFGSIYCCLMIFRLLLYNYSENHYVFLSISLFTIMKKSFFIYCEILCFKHELDINSVITILLGFLSILLRSFNFTLSVVIYFRINSIVSSIFLVFWQYTVYKYVYKHTCMQCTNTYACNVQTYTQAIHRHTCMQCTNIHAGICMQCTDIHAGRLFISINENERRGVEGSNFRRWGLIGSD